MLRFPEKSDLRLAGLVFGALAVVALAATAPVASAFAQGVPHDMLLLDPPQPATKTVVMTTDQHARNAYARSHKTHVAH